MSALSNVTCKKSLFMYTHSCAHGWDVYVRMSMFECYWGMISKKTMADYVAKFKEYNVKWQNISSSLTVGAFIVLIEVMTTSCANDIWFACFFF